MNYFWGGNFFLWNFYVEGIFLRFIYGEKKLVKKKVFYIFILCIERYVYIGVFILIRVFIIILKYILY